ncbi:MAG: Rossmann-like and DUF2520 domain-containing protein [Planctomycetota bacterium]|jgi:predicted short-subunit dehydrogenase-like oxidoreductase (DUF2520 family)
MAIRLAILGPGTVGRALGRCFVEAGVDLLGFVGRNDQSAALAVAFAGRGRVLQLHELVFAHVVVIAVPDPLLPEIVRAAAAAAPGRSCSLWLHTSGRYDLEVLMPLRNGTVRLGALHPVAPFPDAASGMPKLAGRPALLLGDARARRLLERLAVLLGMQPMHSSGGDRLLYHAACALAANGLTALRAAVDRVFAESCVLRPQDAEQLAQALMSAGLQACQERGAYKALSGPVVRGDAKTVAMHRAALHKVAPDLDSVYRALMSQALLLASARGVPEHMLSAVRAALSPELH